MFQGNQIYERFEVQDEGLQKKLDGDFYIFDLCGRLEDLGPFFSQPLQVELDRV